MLQSAFPWYTENQENRKESLFISYQYPIEEHWSRQEIIDVVNFYSMVEKAYESKVNPEDLLLAYNRFKQIVPSKSEEKQLCSSFEKQSGYSCYQTIKKAKNLEGGTRLTMQ